MSRQVLRVRALTDEEASELRRLAGRSLDARVARRVQVIRLSAQGMAPHQIAKTLDRLREHLALKTRVILSNAWLSALMRENRIVCRRPKHGMSHLRDQAEYDEKKAFLTFVKRGRHDQTPSSICCTSTSVRFISTRP